MKRSWAKGGLIGMIMLLAFSLAGGVGPERIFASDEYDAMREKRKVMLTGGTGLNIADADIAAAVSALAAEADGYWQSMNKTASRTALWSDQQGVGNSIHIRISYERLNRMALAYATEGSALYGHTALAADLVSGLDFMYATRYHELVTTTPSGTSNWWDWQIGIPMQLNDTVVIMYDNLNATQINNYMKAVERFTPLVNLTGANRSWKAMVVAIRGILVKDGVKIAAARDGLSQIFPYVVSGDGFYRDGSFIQHSTIPYTGGYGLDLLLAVSDLLVVLHGSTWQVTDPNHANVWDWVYQAYQPLIYKGAMMDMVRGREISRHYRQDHAAGHVAIRGILLLSEAAPAAQAANFKRMVKGWVQSDTYLSFYSDAPVPSIVRAKAIAADPLIQPADSLIGYKQYAGMDRAVQHRPDYSAGLAMYSSRTNSFEAINSENGKAWYTSAGMLSLYNSDLEQYSGDFWPTVDSYRLPGTTVLSQTPSASHKSANAWTGGTDMLGQYGVSGMDLQDANHTLGARKSWFMFDDEIVALGAGITSTDSIAAETIVENRKLSGAGNETLTVNGTVQPASLGWSSTLNSVEWTHLAGSAPGSDIGYYFPGGTSLEAKREARTGNWKQINTRPVTPATPITRSYMTMWLNHGTNPADAAYQYVLLPNKSSAEVAEYAADSHVQVLSNTPAVQAVREKTLHLIGANFWTDSLQSVDFITVNKKASVMTQETVEGGLNLSISDPTQLGTGFIEVELDRTAESFTADAGISVTQLSPTIKLRVNTSLARGKSFKASFQLGDEVPPVTYEDVIVDNNDTAFVAKTGTWKTASTQTDRYGSNYLHDDNAGKGSKSITFTPDLPAAGTYKVYMMWPQHVNRSTAVPLSIGHAAGTASVTVNQTTNGGIWNLLGTFTFNEGKYGFVTLGNEGTSGYVVADAVRFEYVAPGS